jgi:hypothetical protein
MSYTMLHGNREQDPGKLLLTGEVLG